MRSRLSPFSSLPSPSGGAAGQGASPHLHHHHYHGAGVRLGAAPRQAGQRAGSLALHGMVVRPWGAGRARSVEEVGMGEGFLLLRMGGGLLATMGFGDHGQLAHGARESEPSARVCEELAWAPEVVSEWEEEAGPQGKVWEEIASEQAGMDWKRTAAGAGAEGSDGADACAEACARARLPLLSPTLIA